MPLPCKPPTHAFRPAPYHCEIAKCRFGMTWEYLLMRCEHIPKEDRDESREDQYGEPFRAVA